MHISSPLLCDCFELNNLSILCSPTHVYSPTSSALDIGLIWVAGLLEPLQKANQNVEHDAEHDAHYNWRKIDATYGDFVADRS